MNKKLTKSRDNVVISGSLAGIADYIGIDPTIVRVIYVILSVGSFGFPGFLLYIALMILMPSGNRKQKNYSSHYDHPYMNNSSKGRAKKTRKEVEKLDPEKDDWSDF